MLNAKQAMARDHTGSNLLILAGAGSGKTETIAARAIAALNRKGSTGLTLITFTKKAAGALRARFEKAAGSNHNAFIGTFHSLCWRIILDFGYKREIDSSWAIMDQEDSLRLMKTSAQDCNADDCIRILSFATNSEIEIPDCLLLPRFAHLQSNEKEILSAIKLYQHRCQLNKRLDFDSLLAISLNLLSEHIEVLNQVRQRFKTILVDEYQDTNLLQAKLLMKLNVGDNITVVGDDAQSIYSFRAARIENIIEFPKHFDAKQITLDVNYRCPKPILEMAEASLKENRNRLQRNLSAYIETGARPGLIQAQNQAAEAELVANEIEKLIIAKTPLSQISVLYRANRLSIPLQQELQRRNIHFVLPEIDDFFGLPHIKSVVTALRLIIAPTDYVAFTAIFDLLTPNRLEEISETIKHAENTDTPFWKIEVSDEVKSQFVKISQIAQSLEGIEKQPESVTTYLTLVINLLEPSLRRISGGGKVWELWLADLTILQSLAQPFLSLNDFLSSVSLRHVERDTDSDGIKFCSIHAAKGLEWEHVFVIGLVEFWFPMKMAIADLGSDEEERRLFYVASTRARSRLFLSTFRENINPYGRTMAQETSRFVKEIRDHLDVV